MLNELNSILRLAGENLKDRFYNLGDLSIQEKQKNDYVTIADKESEELITSLLIENFPDIPVYGEEYGWQNERNDAENQYWVVDPLDGTKNFIQQIPYFCTTVALVKKGQPVIGVVFDPIHQEFFYAEKNKGAFLNSEKINISPRKEINHGFVATGFPFRTRELMDKYFEAFKDIFTEVSNIRRCGSAALDLSYVSCGRYDAFFEKGLKPWDIAAGVILIKEAGGIVTNFFNDDSYLKDGHIVAGKKEFHTTIIDKISNHFKPEDFLDV